MPANLTVLTLTSSAGRCNRLNLEARSLVDILDHVRVEGLDSARVDSAIDLLSRAAGLLADARGELAQAGAVAHAIAIRDAAPATQE